MKSKFSIWTIGVMALCLMSACANGDMQRVQKAEELLTVNRDSAMAILREVVRPDRLPEESKALYWFCVADIRANTMQSLSEDSMICWAAQYFRNRWLQDGEYEDYMMKAGMEEAFYWWWNDDKEKAQQVLQRQQQYAAEIAEKKGEHIWEVILLRISANWLCVITIMSTCAITRKHSSVSVTRKQSIWTKWCVSITAWQLRISIWANTTKWRRALRKRLYILRIPRLLLMWYIVIMQTY